MNSRRERDAGGDVAPSERRGLAGSLSAPLELLLTSHVVGRRATALLATTELSIAQFAVLSTLSSSGSVSLAGLARRLSVRPQSVGELVNRLHRRGLIGRSHVGRRGSPVTVWPTETGRLLHRRAESLVRALDDPAEWGLGACDADDLVTLLRAVRESVLADDRPGTVSDRLRE